MNQRDLELLSSYLDGQLRPSDSARLERRLSAEPDLRSVLDDLRAARGLLRQLPMRRAPRNFTLTPQMVGKKPPLPRAYPAFRFVTALATLLFFATMGVNLLVPQMASSPLAVGKGGGGAPDVYSAQAPEAAATQAPAATEAPTEAATEAPSAGLSPMLPTATATVGIEAAPLSTTLPPAVEDTARAAENPAEQSVPAPYAAQPQDQNGFSQRPNVQPPVPPAWVILLAGIALFGAVIMLLMRRLAAERWRGKQ